MQIGLIDVDGHKFPNLPLMKISAWHKQKGDHVEWYDPICSGHMDKVYMSKVFSFSPDYEFFIDADEIQKGGSGYCISLVDGKEVFDKSKDVQLPYEIEHIYPDYSIYPELTGYGKPLKDQKCFGFLSRGCPRGCDFCHVKSKEGQRAYKVADLTEFWNGQKYICLCDPNILACPEWKDLLQQLIDSKANVEFNQGIDIRLVTEEKTQMLRQIKLKSVHFAYDRIEDQQLIEPKLQIWTDQVGMKFNRSKVQCYVLCGFKEKKVLPEDLHRIMFLRKHNISPYVMLYDKEHIQKGHELLQLQRWVNNRFIFWKVDSFEDYKTYIKKGNNNGSK